MPPCPDESQYCEINTLLNDYDVKDTTASNTGREKGVNTLPISW